MVEPENLTIVLLRELRADMARISDKIDAIEPRLDKIEARLDKIEARLDAMHLNGVKALKGFIGHRSMTERAMGSIDDQFSRLETRVAALEARA